jgi:hypothetical protein
MGKALILDTPMGQIVKGLVEGGVQLGVSSRGMGSLDFKDGANYVRDDFMLNTIDIVQDPSAPNAFVNGIMENREYYYDIASSSWRPQAVAEAIEEIVEEVERKVNRVVRTIDEATAQRMFQSFIRSLRD